MLLHKKKNLRNAWQYVIKYCNYGPIDTCSRRFCERRDQWRLKWPEEASLRKWNLICTVMEENDSESPAVSPVVAWFSAGLPGGFCTCNILGDKPTFWTLVSCVFPGCLPHVLRNIIHFLQGWSVLLTLERSIRVPHATDTVAPSESVFRAHMSTSFLEPAEPYNLDSE